MMTPDERRAALLRLLSDIDQQIELAKSLATSPLLTRGEQRFAEVQLDFRRRAVQNVERMLVQLA